MAAGTINYFSESLWKASSFNVIFPDHPKVPKPWSVLYLLHGLSDNHSTWSRRSAIERYVEGYPLVVVMPDGGRGWYTNAQQPGYARYEDDLIKDVVGLVDGTFAVRAEREGRAIGGLSMGGYGAIKLGLKHPNKFVSVHSHSGAMGIARRKTEGIEEFKHEYRAIFGDKPKGGPEDDYTLAEKADRSLIPAMWLDCGVEDALLEDNRAYHKHLDKLKVPHEWFEFPGTHSWTYWDEHVREAIEFHARHLKIEKV